MRENQRRLPADVAEFLAQVRPSALSLTLGAALRGCALLPRERQGPTLSLLPLSPVGATVPVL